LSKDPTQKLFKYISLLENANEELVKTLKKCVELLTEFKSSVPAPWGWQEMLDGFETPGWVAKMMGHTSLKMIYEHYYSNIKNYQSEDGQKFIERVYSPIMKEAENTIPNLPHQKKGN